MHCHFPWQKPRSTVVDAVELNVNTSDRELGRDVDEEPPAELKLPKLASLVIIISANTLLQASPNLPRAT